MAATRVRCGLLFFLFSFAKTNPVRQTLAAVLATVIRTRSRSCARPLAALLLALGRLSPQMPSPALIVSHA